MQRLSTAFRRPQEGTFLPMPFRPLEAAGMRIREGTASYVAGTPGSMKTGWTLYYVARIGLPVLYFSADSEPFEMAERAAAMVTGDPTEKVRANPDAYRAALAGLNLRMVFADSPTYDDVELELAAYAEAFGRFPAIVVIDNMLNLVGENEDEWASHRDHAKVIHRIARITKASVLVLAHMSEDRVDPSATPQPRNKLQGRVSQLPKVILSLAFDGQRLKIAAVKNRFGPADPSGQSYVELFCDPATNRFYNSEFDYRQGIPA